MIFRMIAGEPFSAKKVPPHPFQKALSTKRQNSFVAILSLFLLFKNSLSD